MVRKELDYVQVGFSSHLQVKTSQRLLFKHCQFNVSANVKVFPPFVYKTETLSS